MAGSSPTQLATSESSSSTVQKESQSTVPTGSKQVELRGPPPTQATTAPASNPTPPTPPAAASTSKPNDAPKPAGDDAKQKPEKQKAAPPASVPLGPGGKPLSGKALKELKKAEKAAKRANAKAAAGLPVKTERPAGGANQQQQQQQSKQKKSGAAGGAGGIVRTIVLNGEGNQQMSAKVVEKIVEVPAESKKDQGIIALLKELESEQFEKRKNKDSFGIEDAQNDVHPSIVTLGILMNKGIIRGATARTMAMLACLRRVIDDYETPRDQTLIRHLPTSRYLSHQISFLTSARPMTGAMLPPAMGNSIRWLKTEISRINPDLSDDLAKRHLIDRIDAFIHEKFTAADAVIADIAQDYIDAEGSVIVTYSKSSIVQQVLLRANELGKGFRVVVVDNRVTLEGRNLVHTLVEEDIEVEYVHTYALDHVLKDATVCLLGAQSVLADGSVCARAGTALTAAMAKRMNLPVIVCAEMVKFSDRVNIDQIVMNELGDPDALVPENWDTRFPEPGHLKGWQEQPNTMAVSLMYDVTPAELISSIICEHGSTCPTDVPGVTAIAAKRE